MMSASSTTASAAAVRGSRGLHGCAAWVCGARRRQQREYKSMRRRSKTRHRTWSAVSSSLSMTPAEEKGEEEEERMLQPALPSFDEKALVQFVTSRGGSVPPGLRVCERRAADERG